MRKRSRTIRKGLYKRLFLDVFEKEPLRWISDERYLKLLFRVMQGYPLDLDAPETFNEKLQWLKLYDRNPLYTEWTDKYRVREHVAKTIGEQYLVPLLGVWERAEEIDFDALPEQFVLKCNHDAGSKILCRNKETFDKNNAVRKLRKALRKNYYWREREYNYKNIERKILAEELLVCKNGDPPTVYRFLCFAGEPRLICFFTYPEPRYQYYDMDWNYVDIDFGSRKGDAARKDPRPKNFDRMVRLARVLSRDLPHVRVDLYEVDDRVYFNELTFHHQGGNQKCRPFRYDKLLGDYLKLPQQRPEEA